MNQLSPKQTELVSAALRHVRDAEHLLASTPNQSMDQAWHLAGFGPEVIRKACLDERAADKKLGHDFGPVAEGLLEVLIALDAHAARYDLQGWATRAPSLAQWTPEARYCATGTFSEHLVAQLVEWARSRIDDVVAALWADGRLKQAR